MVRGYCEEARRSLELLPDCEAKGSLLELADFVWERGH